MYFKLLIEEKKILTQYFIFKFLFNYFVNDKYFIFYKNYSFDYKK